MDDFIFGSLSSDDLRLQQVRAARGGVTHLQRRTPRDPLPAQPVSVELTVGPEHPLPQAWLYWSDDGGDPAGAHGQASHGRCIPLEFIEAEWDTLLWGYVRRYRGQIPAGQPGQVVRYRLSADDGRSEVFADSGAFYAYYVDDDPAPAWSREAVIYQIFADRFFAPDPSFPRLEGKPSHKCNGSLEGIRQKLPYLSQLGVNCLWLTPIFPSPSYHGYDATSFFDINPRLGTSTDLRRLLDEAHGLGMRLLMDFVPNHWSSEHASFREAQRDAHSPFVHWYTFHKWPHEYKTFFGVKNLPQINLRHPAARQHVLDAARHWLEFGVDGYRVDYCIGPSPDFYAEFRRVTRAARSDSWTFGEAIDPPDSQRAFEGGMDGTLDFILLEAMRQTFATGRWSAARFSDFLARHEAYFPPSFSRPSFLDNHDMNRFLWMAGNDKRRLRLAALCQFTLPGAPVIYYGTEVGLSQERDMRQNGRALHEEGRLPMPWDSKQDAGLLEFYRGLVQLRHATPALRSAERAVLHADAQVLAYRRGEQDGSRVVVLNLSAKPAALTLSIPENTPVFATDPAACQVHSTPSEIQIELPALGGLVLG